MPGLTDEERDEALCRAEAVAREIMGAPAKSVDQVRKKVEVLRSCLVGSSNWTDARPLRLLGSIEADLEILQDQFAMAKAFGKSSGKEARS